MTVQQNPKTLKKVETPKDAELELDRQLDPYYASTRFILNLDTPDKSFYSISVPDFKEGERFRDFEKEPLTRIGVVNKAYQMIYGDNWRTKLEEDRIREKLPRRVPIISMNITKSGKRGKRLTNYSLQELIENAGV